MKENCAETRQRLQTRWVLMAGVLLFCVLFVRQRPAAGGVNGRAVRATAASEAASHETMLPLLTLPPGPPGWTITCVVCGHGFDLFSSRAAAADGAGTVHVAYGGRQLYHAWQEGSGPWQVEVVDGAYNTGLGATLALDGGGHPHIFYWDAGNMALKYAWYNGVNWVREFVPSAPVLPGAPEAPETQMAVDGLGQAHVTLAVDGTLFYGLRAASGWQWEAVVAGGVGAQAAIAVDQLGQPHIAYVSGTQVAYATFDGVDWLTHVFAEPAEGAEHPSITVDSSGRAQIAAIGSGYGPDNVSGVFYFYEEQNAWQDEVIVADYDGGASWDFAHYGFFTSLALDGNETAYALFGGEHGSGNPYNLPHREISYAHRTATGWEVESGAYLPLSLEPRGSVVVRSDNLAQGFYDNEGELRSYLPGVPYSGTTVDWNRNAGGSLAILDVDVQGRPQLLYTDEGNNGLWYGLQQGGVWEQERISDDDTWGTYTLALGPDSRPHVAYVTGGCTRFGCNSWINYVTRTEQGWEKSGAASERGERTIAGDVTPGTVAMAVDSSGVPHLSYLAGGINYYLYDPQAGAEDEKVDVNGTGRPWIATDALNRPHIIYRRNDFLIHAMKEGDTWVKRTIEWGPDDPLLAFGFDATGLLRLVYIRPAPTFAQQALRMATFDGSTWQKQDILRDGPWPDAIAALDAAGGLHFLYRQQEVLHYRTYDGNGWVERLVLDISDVGDISNIAAPDPQATRITLYDPFLGGLKMLTMDPG